MLRRLFENLMYLLKNVGRKREDISWKEISGIMKEDKSKK